MSLPPIGAALVCRPGSDSAVSAEVYGHRDRLTVRGIAHRVDARPEARRPRRERRRAPLRAGRMPSCSAASSTCTAAPLDGGPASTAATPQPIRSHRRRAPPRAARRAESTRPASRSSISSRRSRTVRRAAVFGGAGVGKTVVLTEFIHNAVEELARRRRLRRASASARARVSSSGRSCARRGVLDRTVLVFGQMKEPPGARFLVGLAALSVAEYFRDELGRDVLFVVDNVYRHVQAGMEVSGLLGRMPSRVGYQPTLAADLAVLEERITATQRGDMVSAAGDLRPRRRLLRPRRHARVLAPRQRARPVARRRRRGPTTRPSIRWPPRRRRSIPRSSARATTTSSEEARRMLARYRGAARHHLDARRRGALRRRPTPGRTRAPPAQLL